MVQLPTVWPCPGQEEQVDWTQPSRDWPHAGHQEHETRYCVFRDLWGRGYYVTSGSKFGGDFLVYPGELWQGLLPRLGVELALRKGQWSGDY